MSSHRLIELTKACDYGYPSLDRISPTADTEFRRLHDGCHTGLLRVYKEAA